jgi:hypothetical protein
MKQKEAVSLAEAVASGIRLFVTWRGRLDTIAYSFYHSLSTLSTSKF